MCLMLLQAGADPTIESGVGWTPLHNAISCGNTNVANIIKARCSPEFLESFDPSKPRNLFARETCASDSVNVFTQADICQGIKDGKYRKIVVLTGAGISVASGIPAFRTPTGIYSNPAMKNLFRPEIFSETPLAFYDAVRSEEH